MSAELQSLRGMIHRLEADVAALRGVADDLEKQERTHMPVVQVLGNSIPGLNLPSDITLPNPGAVAAFLADRPVLSQIVSEMAVALVQEFALEPSQILLSLAQDEHVDAHYLVFTVRLPVYSVDSDLLDRLDRVSTPFDARLSSADGWILATTDYVLSGPI